MKRKNITKLLVSAMTAFILLTGCGNGNQQTEEKEDNIQISEEQMAESKDKEDESFEDISWTWSIDTYTLFRMMIEDKEVDPKLFLGIVTYGDGAMGSVKADGVELSYGSDIMTIDIEYRGEVFSYSVEVPELWGDGETLTDEQIEDFKNMENTAEPTFSGQVSGKVYKEELTEVDWELVGEVIEGDFGKGFSEELEEAFAVLSRDPRVDWSLVNSEFHRYYGNTRDGIAWFIADIHHSGTSTVYHGVDDDFIWVKAISVQPMMNKDENGEYDALYSEYYPKTKEYQEKAAREEQYQAEQEAEREAYEADYRARLKGDDSVIKDAEYVVVYMSDSKPDEQGRGGVTSDGREYTIRDRVKNKVALYKNAYPESYDDFVSNINVFIEMYTNLHGYEFAESFEEYISK